MIITEACHPSTPITTKGNFYEVNLYHSVLSFFQQSLQELANEIDESIISNSQE